MLDKTNRGHRQLNAVEGHEPLCPRQPARARSDIGQGQIGFSRLAKRTIYFTNCLVVSAVIIVATLAAGRTIVSWWFPQYAGEDSPYPAVSFPPEEFSGYRIPANGLRWTVEQQNFAGSADELINWIAQRFASSLQQSSWPTVPVGAAEQRVLERLAEATPVLTGTHWAVYAEKKPLLMVVGVVDRQSSKTTNDSQSDIEPQTAAEQWQLSSDRDPDRRIVLWAIGLPRVENAAPRGSSVQYWRVLLFESPTVSTQQVSAVEFPLPDFVQVGLKLIGEDGAQLAHFQSTEAVEKGKYLFDRWAEKNGWHPISGWQLGLRSWSRVFRKHFQEKIAVAQINLIPEPDGGFRGIIAVENRALHLEQPMEIRSP